MTFFSINKFTKLQHYIPPLFQVIIKKKGLYLSLLKYTIVYHKYHYLPISQMVTISRVSLHEHDKLQKCLVNAINPRMFPNQELFYIN